MATSKELLSIQTPVSGGPCRGGLSRYVRGENECLSESLIPRNSLSSIITVRASMGTKAYMQQDQVPSRSKSILQIAYNNDT